MVKRRNHPSIGWWALPGGFIELHENLEDTARRELTEETGVADLPMEQFAVYGNVTRGHGLLHRHIFRLWMKGR